MAVEVVLPMLGVTVEKGKITEWLKAEGDSVEKGDSLFVTEADKVSTEVESPASGVLAKILVPENVEVPVLTPVAIITEAGEEIPADMLAGGQAAEAVPSSAPAAPAVAPAPAASAPAPAPAPAATPGGPVRAMPAARRLAREKNLDLAAIAGTGPDGVITHADVENASTAPASAVSTLARRLAGQEGVDLAAVAGSGVRGRVMRSDVTSHLKHLEEAGPQLGQAIPMSSIRQVIARRMSESAFNAPHIYFFTEINLDPLLSYRKALLPQVEDAFGLKLSINDFLIKAVALNLLDFPMLNSRLEGDQVVISPEINVGLAVAQPEGLIVPAIEAADRQGLVGICQQRLDLVARARVGKLTLPEMERGTFTISSLAQYDITHFTAILNPPQSGILSVGKTEQRLYLDQEGQVKAKRVSTMGLGVDHRIIDGAVAADFLQNLKRKLESPIFSFSHVQIMASLKTYDLAVIGGGPGGYHAAILGAQHGMSVLLVEKDALGGTCLNRGCIPTKSFLSDTGLYDQAKRSPVLTGAEGLGFDLAAMVNRKKSVVNTLVGGLGKIIASHGIEVLSGSAQLEASGRLWVDSRLYKANNIILATGSRPAVPPFITIDGEIVQTTDQALDPSSVPSHLAIIGGGVIGLEFASIFSALGSQVTILEMLPDIITSEDAEVRRTIRALLPRRGIELHTETAVQEIALQGDAAEIVYQDKSGKAGRLIADRVLVATGRAPVLEGLDAPALGLAKEGPFVKIDQDCRTNLPGVYAIGDLVGGMMLAHKASAEAEAALAKIMGKSKPVHNELIPRCIWCRPEVASVGLGEEEANRTGRKIGVGRFNLPGSGKAQAMGHVDGFVKIVADRDNGEILGVHMVGEHSTDMIGEAVLAMTMEGAVEDLADIIKPHPTLSENLMEAALDWSGLAIHTLKRGQKERL